MASAKVSSKVGNEACIICCHSSDYYMMGECNHPLCYECSTRLRVICENKDCPVCRTKLPNVLMVDSSSKHYGEYTPAKFHRHKRGDKVGVLFVNNSALNVFCDILAHVCTVCANETDFCTFVELERHMRRVHNLHYCDLCTKHLKLFSWERKCYTRHDLALHRRLGDPDDRSHRGHPTCEFCDERFLDPDHLFAHLRRDHYFCHFCDADGENKFYDTYEVLRVHFRDSHFLCEEGNCVNEQFTSVFRSDIDLKGHQLCTHSKDKKRQDRVVNVNITYNNPRPGAQGFRGSFGGRGGRQNQSSYGGPSNENNERGGGRGQSRDVRGAPLNRPRPTLPPATDVPPPTHDIIPIQKEGGKGGSKISTVLRVPASQPEANGEEPPDAKFQMEKADFPSLGGSGNNQTGTGKKGWRLGRTRSGSLDEKDFPVLGGAVNRPSVPARRSPPLKVPKNAKQTEPPKNGSRPPQRGSGLVMIDDDEMFPSLAKIEKEKLELEMAKKLKESLVVEEETPAEGVPSTPTKGVPLTPAPPPSTVSLYEQMNSGGWKNKPSSLGQAVMCLGDSNSFPSLQPAKPKIKGISEARPSEMARNQQKSSKTWSNIANPKGVTGVILNNNNNLPKGKHLPEPEEWPASAQTSGDTINLVKLPKSKSKARRVAQKKQRSSLSEDNPTPMDMDVPPGFSTLPPPGMGPSPGREEEGAPPGFEDFNLSHKTFARSQFSDSEFIKPPGFNERNLKLFTKIEHKIGGDEEKIGDFKLHSTMFRRGEIGADCYYDKMLEIIGSDSEMILAEILCLLPDIHKQRSLLAVFESRNKLKSGAKNKWNKSKETIFDSCPTCGQVLLKVDLPAHEREHAYPDFPALS